MPVGRVVSSTMAPHAARGADVVCRGLPPRRQRGLADVHEDTPAQEARAARGARRGSARESVRSLQERPVV
eukprot:9477322-Pyramimonas_sp.AAC.1